MDSEGARLLTYFFLAKKSSLGFKPQTPSCMRNCGRKIQGEKA